MRLLIIEDESGIAQPLKKALEKKGFAVDWVEDGKKGFEMAVVNGYDCILLDLNLPEMDGIELCKRLREDKNETPILMLTARSQQINKIEGFETGADDYLTKPFDFKELVLRIRALVKRNSVNKAEVLETGKLKLFPGSNKVKVDRKKIQLNTKEFGILEYLLRNKGKIISQEELLEHVWDREIDTFTSTVKTHIKTLRKKVDPEKRIIETVRGAGYVVY